MEHYLFYDIETTGLNKCFDQVLQFAAIRTDLAFNELERHEITIKLNPESIPSPAAMITHRIGMHEMQQGESEYEAIKKIHALMNQSQTINLGYNTLGFDDEFLRFSFFRNLLEPYTHQYANGCRRMDLYPITVFYRLFKSQILTWPDSLRLEHICANNNLAQGQAHNALTDVIATAALARKLAVDSQSWQYLTGYFRKNIEMQRIKKLPTLFTTEIGKHYYALMVSGILGSQANYIVPVIYLGQHYHYKNQSLWMRLDKEISEQNCFIIRKKPSEPPFLLPPLERYLNLITTERQEISNRNITLIKEKIEWFSAICNYHLNWTYPVIDNLDPQAALYDVSFLSEYQKKLFEKFHRANLDEKIALVETLDHPVYRQLAQRLIARNYFMKLPPQKQQQYIMSIATSEAVDLHHRQRYSICNALADIDNIQQNRNLDSQQQQLLVEMNCYLKQRQSEISQC